MTVMDTLAQMNAPAPVLGDRAVDYNTHPIADIFPMMSDDELAELAADIKANGLREPICVHDGRIIDGRNRYLACERAGIEPRFKVYPGDDNGILPFVLSLNLHRRHLNESQRAAVAARVANIQHGGDRRSDQAADLPLVSQAEAARLLKVSERTVRSAKKVLDHGTPELIEAVERGEMSVSRAADLAVAAAPRQAAPDRKRELHEVVSLEEWKALPPDQQQRLLSPDPAWGATSFNREVNDSIGWAKWSWNPVIGCLHPCPFCYARDIANGAKMAKSYPFGFKPAFRPRCLLTPNHTKPRDASTDWTERNVFVCSMADLFGRWVPAEWIEAVFEACRAAPEWTFLFLTKFPQRMAEFELPENGWYGTTVDLQARVKNAEQSFEKIKTISPKAKTWLSVEPMLEPLKFTRLDLFDWVVIGGASASSATAGSPATPEWKPPFLWIADLPPRRTMPDAKSGTRRTFSALAFAR